MSNEPLRAPLRPLRRILAGAALLLAAGALAAEAQTLPDPGQPGARPGLFDRLFDRREHLRRSAPLHRRAAEADRAAQRARERADEARRAGALPPLPRRAPAQQPAAPFGDPHDRQAAAEGLRQHLIQDRLQRFLDSAGRADSAMLEAELAGARAARTQTVVRGMERLQAGAAAARSTLGERPAPGPRPLIRMPRVEPD